MDIETIVRDILLPSLMTGLFIGGAIFLLGLAINLCLKLFDNS